MYESFTILGGKQLVILTGKKIFMDGIQLS